MQAGNDHFLCTEGFSGKVFWKVDCLNAAHLSFLHTQERFLFPHPVLFVQTGRDKRRE